jgi:hypothetical protein
MFFIILLCSITQTSSNIVLQLQNEQVNKTYDSIVDEKSYNLVPTNITFYIPTNQIPNTIQTLNYEISGLFRYVVICFVFTFSFMTLFIV